MLGWAVDLWLLLGFVGLRSGRASEKVHLRWPIVVAVVVAAAAAGVGVESALPQKDESQTWSERMEQW